MTHPKSSRQTPLIRYPRFNELHNDIQLCQEMTSHTGEPSCMVLEGMTGAGKSTLVQAYAANFPRYEAEDGTRIPVFALMTPSPITVKGMASHMLAELGDPAAYRGTLQNMNARLIHYLKVCEVELVILDDFQHLIDSETNKILAKVSDWLKVLIKETGIPFLVIGIEDSVERILRANQQLSRLFAVRETLHPFSLATEDEAKDFHRFLEFAEQAVKMPIQHDLSPDEFLARMYFATEGVVANLMNLLRFAALLAQKEGEATLSLQLLDQAFNKRLQRHLIKPPNPFSTPLKNILVGLQGKTSDSTSTVKKSRTKSASEVLNTK
ncbi:MAG: TniB family NTP-binding protein [Anaerolineae bacterium]|nr:TniB family NTP-binding protein [Anaerolineae bacterium]